jgi:signal transduction histidine kinase
VRQAISDLELKIEDSGAQIFCSELPVIKGHPHQIKQLFLNLLSNAIKFRKAQAVPQIRVLCAKVSEPLLPDHSVLAGAFLELKIIDNGIGFEQLFAEKIFTIFQRLNGKAEYTGSGIGLAICRKIVENHGGKIYANSGIGLGATFTILLPYNY